MKFAFGATEITVSTAEAAHGGAPGVQVRVHDDGRPCTPPAPDVLSPGRRGLGNVRTVFTLWPPLRRAPGHGTPAAA